MSIWNKDIIPLKGARFHGFVEILASVIKREDPREFSDTPCKLLRVNLFLGHISRRGWVLAARSFIRWFSICRDNTVRIIYLRYRFRGVRCSKSCHFLPLFVSPLPASERLQVSAIMTNSVSKNGDPECSGHRDDERGGRLVGRNFGRAASRLSSPVPAMQSLGISPFHAARTGEGPSPVRSPLSLRCVRQALLRSPIRLNARDWPELSRSACARRNDDR